MVRFVEPEKSETLVSAQTRRSTLVVAGDALMEEFTRFAMEDEGIIQEAIAAANEMRQTPVDHLDKRLDDAVNRCGSRRAEGYVSRRAPMNPLSSPKLGRFRTMKGPEKVEDPALEDNPLRGRLVATFAVNAILFFVFSQSLIYNRVVFGSFYAPHSVNSMIGPEPQALYDLGGLHTTRVREGEIVRLFWAMWMHSGWIHISFNLLCQLQYMYMFEPDWGFWRTIMTFFLSGLSGNLVTAICDPCSVTVGSSGGLFGLMGAMVVYCTEFWDTIPRPLCIIIFSIVVIIASLMMGFTGTTANWAHMGGLAGGVLFSFGTVTQLAVCKKRRNQDDEQPLKGKQTRIGHRMKDVISPSCSCGKLEWTVRISCWVALVIMWVVCFYFLLIATDYMPPGHLTFSGVNNCCCCTPPGYNLTQCAQCDYKPNGKDSFGEVCKAVAEGKALLSRGDERMAMTGGTLSEIFTENDWDKIKSLTRIISFDKQEDVKLRF